MIKVYSEGVEFIKDNLNVLEEYPVELNLFKVNALYMGKCNELNYCFKVYQDYKYLLIVAMDPWNIKLFGDESLLEECVDFIVERDLKFSRLLCSSNIGTKFLDLLQRKKNISYSINFNMTILHCPKINNYSCEKIEKANENDVDVLAKYLYDFQQEALRRNEQTIEELKGVVLGKINNTYIIRKNNKIVSMAMIVRMDEKSACISEVYTIKEYRGQGLCFKLVSYVTDIIIKSGKIAYLFVDNNNPISNKVYRKIGYVDLIDQVEYQIIPATNL